MRTNEIDLSLRLNFDSTENQIKVLREFVSLCDKYDVIDFDVNCSDDGAVVLTSCIIFVG